MTQIDSYIEEKLEKYNKYNYRANELFGLLNKISSELKSGQPDKLYNVMEILGGAGKFKTAATVVKAANRLKKGAKSPSKTSPKGTRVASPKGRQGAPRQGSLLFGKNTGALPKGSPTRQRGVSPTGRLGTPRQGSLLFGKNTGVLPTGSPTGSPTDRRAASPPGRQGAPMVPRAASPTGPPSGSPPFVVPGTVPQRKLSRQTSAPPTRSRSESPETPRALSRQASTNSPEGRRLVQSPSRRQLSPPLPVAPIVPQPSPSSPTSFKTAARGVVATNRFRPTSPPLPVAPIVPQPSPSSPRSFKTATTGVITMNRMRPTTPPPGKNVQSFPIQPLAENSVYNDITQNLADIIQIIEEIDMINLKEIDDGIARLKEKISLMGNSSDTNQDEILRLQSQLDETSRMLEEIKRKMIASRDDKIAAVEYSLSTLNA